MEGEMAGVVQDVVRPGTLDEALTVLAELKGPRKLLAGGTDLLAQAKEPGYPAATWINLWGLRELRGIDVQDERVVLGANVTMSEVTRSDELKRVARPLWDGCWEAGSVQIRNRATLGGNAGNASPAADSVPGLFALGASLHLVSKRGEREVPIEEFATAPRRTVLQPDELIARFSFSRQSGSGAFMRLGQRKAQAISKVSCAAQATFDGDAVASVRIAFGAVAPTIVRAPRTEAFLSGRDLADPGVLGEAMEVARTEVTPIDDVRSTKAYRLRMAGVVLKRVLELVNERR